MNAFGGMFAAAGYHQAAAAAADPYSRMAAAGIPDPTGAATAAALMHHHHTAAAAAHHMHHQYTSAAAAHQYKVPRLYFKIPRVLPYKDQREKFESDDYFKKLQRESEVIFFISNFIYSWPGVERSRQTEIVEENLVQWVFFKLSFITSCSQEDC